MTVREAFYLGQFEVTLGQFRQFVRDTGYKTTAETNGKGGERLADGKIEASPDYIWSNPIDSETDDHPVVFVSIEDARQFCLWLSKQDGRRYAVPREDQWEFACRAGTTTRWFEERDVQRIAWVRENSEGRLHPVGRKAANPFGLHDMHGNAGELCEPVPPKKVARRGGESSSGVVSCRSASRWELGESLPWFRNGFRVAIVGDLKPPTSPPTPVPVAKSEPPAVAPFTDADVKRIAALPVAEQIEEVRKELVRRNPGFDGTIWHKIEGDVVTEIGIVTDRVTDVAPIRVFSALRSLDLYATHTDKYKGNGQLADLSPLAGMNLAGLTRLNLSYTMVGDAGLVHFKDCANLTYLNLDSTQVSDAGLATFKNCTNLTQLLLGRTKINDAGLAHFRNCKKLNLLDLSELSVGDTELGYFKECENLTRLGLGRTLVTDAGLAHFRNCKKLQHVNLLGTKVGNVGLASLKDCKELAGLFIGSTKVTDLSLLREMPLKELDCDFRPERDAEILRSIKTLEKINRKPAAEFWKEIAAPRAVVAPFTDADVKRIAGLPAAEQVEEVRQELKRRNPGFDGTMRHKIVEDVVTEIGIVTDRVTDVAPIRVFNALRSLDCGGTMTNAKPNGQLSDLALEGMNLASLAGLALGNTRISDAGLAHFQVCKNLTSLHLHATPVGDPGLAHFKDCKNLYSLGLSDTQVTDLGLAHFKDCKNLMLLNLSGTKVSDEGLAHFQDCPNLRTLHLSGTQVSDAGLVHFENCKYLTTLNLVGTHVTDEGLAHCKDWKSLADLRLSGTRVSEAGLKHLKGLRLKKLFIAGTDVTDLKPLQGMALEDIRLTPRKIAQGLDVLRDMKSLQTIGIGPGEQGWPAAEFWERYDRGEFK